MIKSPCETGAGGGRERRGNKDTDHASGHAERYAQILDRGITPKNWRPLASTLPAYKSVLFATSLKVSYSFNAVRVCILLPSSGKH